MTGVVFDFGNVLYHVDYPGMARRLAGARGEEWLQRFQGSALQIAFESGRANLEDLLAGLARDGFPVEKASFLEAFLDVFTPVAGMRQVVERLARRRPLGLLSNTCPEHAWGFIEKTPELRLIPSRVYSFEVGKMKPAPEIYRASVARMGLAPSELVFIDDIPEYAAAAEAVGITGIPFRGASDLVARLCSLGFHELEELRAGG